MSYTTQLKLAGLTCGACERLVTKRIQKITGVTAVSVSAQNGLADITADRPIETSEVAIVLSGTNYSVVTN